MSFLIANSENKFSRDEDYMYKHLWTYIACLETKYMFCSRYTTVKLSLKDESLLLILCTYIKVAYFVNILNCAHT